MHLFIYLFIYIEVDKRKGKRDVFLFFFFLRRRRPALYTAGGDCRGIDSKHRGDGTTLSLRFGRPTCSGSPPHSGSVLPRTDSYLKKLMIRDLSIGEELYSVSAVVSVFCFHFFKPKIA